MYPRERIGHNAIAPGAWIAATAAITSAEPTPLRPAGSSLERPPRPVRCGLVAETIHRVSRAPVRAGKSGVRRCSMGGSPVDSARR